MKIQGLSISTLDVECVVLSFFWSCVLPLFPAFGREYLACCVPLFATFCISRVVFSFLGQICSVPQLVLVLEYAPGVELFDAILSKKKFSEDEARPVFVQASQHLTSLLNKMGWVVLLPRRYCFLPDGTTGDLSCRRELSCLCRRCFFRCWCSCPNAYG